MPARCTSCSTCSARTWCCSSAAARSATRWASRPAPPPTASRSKRWSWRATRAATSSTKGPEILRRGGQVLPAAASQALDTWKRRHLQLRLDRHAGLRARRPTAAESRSKTTMRITQGAFSFLPDLTDAQIRAQVAVLPRQWLGRQPRVHRRPASAQHLLGDVGQPDVRPPDAAGVMLELNACRKAFRRPLHPRRRLRRDAAAGRSVRLSFIVNRPAEEPGFRLERQEGAGRTIRYTPCALRRPTSPAGERYG